MKRLLCSFVLMCLIICTATPAFAGDGTVIPSISLDWGLYDGVVHYREPPYTVNNVVAENATATAVAAVKAYYGPGPAYVPCAGVVDGLTVTVLEKSGDYYLCEYDTDSGKKTRGYISADDLSGDLSGVSEEYHPIKRLGVNNSGSDVTVYSGTVTEGFSDPDAYTVIGTIAPNEIVTVLKFILFGNWYRVEYYTSAGTMWGYVPRSSLYVPIGTMSADLLDDSGVNEIELPVAPGSDVYAMGAGTAVKKVAMDIDGTLTGSGNHVVLTLDNTLEGKQITVTYANLDKFGDDSVLRAKSGPQRGQSPFTVELTIDSEPVAHGEKLGTTGSEEGSIQAAIRYLDERP